MKFSFYILLLASTLLMACKPNDFIQDREIKGMLTIDKSAMGNEFLEFNTESANMTRFIHPGKKIISVKKSGSTATVKIHDGRRVLLAEAKANIKDLDASENKLFIPAARLKQNWDFLAERIKVPLQVEYLATSGTHECGGGSLKGQVWRVFDYRGDYTIKFLVPGTDKVWAQFLATGERLTDTSLENVKECKSPIKSFRVKQEAF